MSGQHVSRSDESDRAVQPHGIVVFHVALDQAPRILRRQWRSGADAFSFERFVPALDFSIRLRIVTRCPHVGHTRNANELFEVTRDELRAVIGDDLRSGPLILLLGRLENDFES
jgi:hypothetical protein